MARTPGPVMPALTVPLLLARGIPRDRAVLGARIGALRVENGWTHHVMGRKAGINGTYLRQLEVGERNPGLDQLLRLARAFGLSSLEQLFGPLPTEELIE
jgi:transcriptional regulator with XRE-family HTH domain